MAKVIQRHHLQYPSPGHPDQEWVEEVYRGEHECLSKLDWYTRKDVSMGCLKALELFILKNRDRAVNLSIDWSDKQEIK